MTCDIPSLGSVYWSDAVDAEASYLGGRDVEIDIAMLISSVALSVVASVEFDSSEERPGLMLSSAEHDDEVETSVSTGVSFGPSVVGA